MRFIVKPGQAQGDRLGLAPLLTSSGPERQAFEGTRTREALSKWQPRRYFHFTWFLSPSCGACMHVAYIYSIRMHDICTVTARL